MRKSKQKLVYRNEAYLLEKIPKSIPIVCYLKFSYINVKKRVDNLPRQAIVLLFLLRERKKLFETSFFSPLPRGTRVVGNTLCQTF